MGRLDQPQAQQEYQYDQQGIEAPPYEAYVDENQPAEIVINYNIDEQVNYNVTDVTEPQTYIVEDQYPLQQDQADPVQFPPPQQDQADPVQFPPPQQDPQADPVQYPSSQQNQQPNPIAYPSQQNQQQNPVRYPPQQNQQQNPIQYPPQQDQQQNSVQYSPQQNQQQNPVQYPPQQNQQQNPVQYPPQQNQQQNPVQYPPQQNQQQNPVQYSPQQNQQQNPIQYPSQQNQQQNHVRYPPQQNQQQNPIQYPPQQNPPMDRPMTPPPPPGSPMQYPPTQPTQPVQFPPQPSQAGHQPYQASPPPQYAPPPIPQNLQMGVYGSPMPQSPYKPAPGIPMANQFPNPVAQVGTEPWRTGLFDCMDDPQNAILTACFPCLTFGQIAEIIDNGHTTCATSGLMYGCIAFLIGCPCILSCTYRTKLRSRFGLMEAPAPDWVTHCLCEWCALCQEYRELNLRGLDPSIGWQGNLAKNNIQQQMAMKPPTSQTMNY